MENNEESIFYSWNLTCPHDIFLERPHHNIHMRGGGKTRGQKYTIKICIFVKDKGEVTSVNFCLFFM